MKMLLAVDLRHEPERVVEEATAWVVRFGAVVDVVYVDELRAVHGFVGGDYLRPMLTREWDRVIAEDHTALASLLALLPEANRGQPLLADGPAARTLAEKAAGYDLVALGTHGRTGLAHLWLGSVAESVVRHSATSVLVLRPGSIGAAPRVLVALDLNGDPERLLDRACPWLDRIGATVDLLHVDAGRLALAAVRDPTVQIELEHHWVRARAEHAAALAILAERLPYDRRGRMYVEDGAPVEAILARASEYDLLVTGAHGQTGLKLAVLGSVTERVIRRSPRPVLVVR